MVRDQDREGVTGAAQPRRIWGVQGGSADLLRAPVTLDRGVRSELRGQLHRGLRAPWHVWGARG